MRRLVRASMAKALTGRTEHLSVSVTPALKAALRIEAWECGEKLPDYIRGLLERRGKWARSVRKVGGYDVGPAK